LALRNTKANGTYEEILGKGEKKKKEKLNMCKGRKEKYVIPFARVSA
jgi:hypothetical protein